MQGTLRSIRLPAVVLLLLCTLASPAAAQQFVCWPIAPGDTTSSLARRLMGNASAAYSLAFQIRDPARRMFVPKSHYQRLRLQSTWQACVAPGPVPSAPIASAPAVKLAAWALEPYKPAVVPTQVALTATQSPVVRQAQTLFNVPFASTVGAAVVVIMFFSLMGGSLTRRPIPLAVRRAGENFITVFAQPLLDASSEDPPIQTKLRFVRRRQQLEIFIAPGPGRRYPNLADHKTNVDYDVDRVMRELGKYVLSNPPRARGKWVVVTISPAVWGKTASEREKGPRTKVLGVPGRASDPSETSRTQRDLAERISGEPNLASERERGPGTKVPGVIE